MTRCDRDTSLMPDTDIIRFLRMMLREPKGTIVALAGMIGIGWTSLIDMAQRGYVGHHNDSPIWRAKFSHIIPLIQSGRLTFERHAKGLEDGKRNRTGLKPVLHERPLEERLVLNYPVEHMRTIARRTNDLPHIRLRQMRRGVHGGNRGGRGAVLP